MQIVREKISNDKLKNMSNMFGGLVKAVVDVEKGLMAVDAEFYADLEEFLLSKNGSKPECLWGINIYPDKVAKDSWIEFDSLVNIRPSMGNRTIGISNPGVRAQIVAIVNKLVVRDDT